MRNGKLTLEDVHSREISTLKNDDAFEVFGVELETLVGDDVTFREDRTRFFRTTPDRSIHGDGTGVEWVMRPMDGRNGKVALKHFSEFCRENHISVNASCGYHLHLFFPKYLQNIKTIKKVMLAYYVTERFWFSLVPASRRDGRYCKSMANYFREDEIRNFKDIAQFLSSFYEDEIKSKTQLRSEGFADEKYPPNNGEKRYTWVNFHSVFLRDTLEIRLHSGTTDARKVFMWYRLHKKFLRWVERHSMKDIEEMAKNPQSFLLKNVYKTKSFSNWILSRQQKVRGGSDV